MTFVDERFIDLSNAVVTNVPRKHTSEVSYGFDHAKLLAELVSEKIGVEYCTSIARHRGGKDQKKLDASKRFENSKGKFYLCNDAYENIRGKLVILIDDVVTSGASMAEAIRVMRKKKVKAIFGLCISVAKRKQV
jgi:competence protein ComFC